MALISAITFYFFGSPSDDYYVIDHFEKTKPMSTFTFGFVVSQLSEIERTYHTELTKPSLTIYGRKDFHKEINVRFLQYVTYWKEWNPVSRIYYKLIFRKLLIVG